MLSIAILMSFVACNNQPAQDPIPEHIHGFGEWYVSENATCTESGVRIRSCECGENQSEAIPANGHVEENLSAKESTCTETGLTEGKKCSICGEILAAQQEVPLKAHAEVIDEETDATCTKTGLTEGSHCSACGITLVAQKEIPLAAHTYDDKYDDNCNVCGHIRDAECAHIETEIINGYEATCTSTGLTDGEKCSKCGELLTSQKVAGVKPHTEVIDNAFDATCTFTGLTEGKHCSVCGLILVAQTIVPMLEHTYSSVITPPTCTEQGYTTYTCNCGDCYVSNYVDKIAHNFGEWFVVKDSTTSDEGLRERWCDCGERETEIIPLKPYSEGLHFTRAYGKNAYIVSGIGTCTDIKVIIPDTHGGLPVCGIGPNAFSNADQMESIVIPSSVESMSTNVFVGCKSLKNVYISPDSSIQKLMNGVFSGCSSLEKVVLPDSITVIENSVFTNCSSLQEINLPASLTSIGSGAFQNCYSLTNITIPDSVTEIGTNAFKGCYSLIEICNLSSINIEKGSTENGYIGYYAEGVVTAPLQSCIRKIKNCVFYDDGEKVCFIKYHGDEKQIELPQYDEKKYGIHKYAFYQDKKIESVVMPDNVTDIGEYAFYECSSLNYVEFGNSLIYIGNYSFYSCESLIQITVPDLVTTIGANSFQLCSSLVNVVIGNSVTNIGDRAFLGCNSLIEVCNKSSLNIVKSSSNYGYISYYLENIYTDPSETHLKIVGSYVFYDDGVNVYLVKCFGTESDITLPTYNEGQKYEIYKYAFYKNIRIRSVNIPECVTAIGESAFSYCKSLLNVTISEGLTKIGGDGFYGCTSLVEINIPDSMHDLGDRAFFNCESLKKLSIPEGVTYFRAVSGCKSLEILSLPNTLTYIDSSQFNTCVNLRYNKYDNAIYLGNEDNPYVILISASDVTISECIIHENTSYIYASAFIDCSLLTEIIVPDTVTIIDNDAFKNCSSLTSVVLPNSIAKISSGVFEKCVSLTTVIIPSNVTSIGTYAFKGCSSLSNIVIPDKVTTIGQEAFASCESLTSINIPASTTSIGREAFYNCTSLSSADFENPYSWKCRPSGLSTIYYLQSNMVSDDEQAAEYLTTTYDDAYWYR